VEKVRKREWKNRGLGYLGMDYRKGKARRRFCISKSHADVGSGADGRDEDDQERVKRMVRSNNFTQQTNALDVDKHM